jgi:hypothetical protein
VRPDLQLMKAAPLLQVEKDLICAILCVLFGFRSLVTATTTYRIAM